MTQLAPIYISFMLNCYFSGDPEATLGEAHWNSPAGRETRKWLRKEGLIDGTYKATDRGTAWVQFICQTPLPEQTWTMPSRVVA